MRVAIISKASQLGGGGSKVASKLAKLLRQNGHFCHHFRRDKEYGYGEDESCVYGPREQSAKYWNHRLRAIGFQELVPWEYAYLKSELTKMKIDIVHIHDTTTAISPFTIIKLAKDFPVIWTMHDFSPITGGCINPLTCERYKQVCGQCPQKSSWPLGGKFDLTSLHLKMKRWVHGKSVHFISPSSYLRDKACEVGLPYENITVINNSVDVDIFRPLDKSAIKEEFGLSPHKFTVLLIAFRVSDPLKGYDDALKILRCISKQVQVLVVGKINEKEKNQFIGIDCSFAGYIENESTLNKCYNAADIFMNCSKADNFPLVVLESLAAGTPVYGYATGGMAEMVENGKTGYLVETGNWQKLSKVISNRLSNLTSDSPEECRLVALANYSNSTFLNNTLVCYKNISLRQVV